MKKLHIANFLLFEKADIEIRPITILIGPQATGKSVIAKLVYIFNEFPRICQDVLWEMPESAKDAIGKIGNRMQEIFHGIFSLVPGGKWSGEMKISLKTETDELSFTVNKKENRIIFNLGDGYAEYINDHLKNVAEFRTGSSSPLLQTVASVLDNKDDTLMGSLKYELLRKIVFNNQAIDEELHRSLFIPAGRSYFSVVDINPYLQINVTTADYFFRTFAGKYKEVLQQIELHHHHEKQIKDNMFAVEIPNGIVAGKYLFDTDKKKGYIAHENGLVCELKHASSGEQEFLPLFLSLLQKEDSGFIIEEPEAHLFPKSQKEVTRFLLSHRNAAGDVFITTHSPYILASFNNLLYAGIIHEKLTPSKKTELGKLIPEECLVKENSLAAYYVDNGTAKDIIDPETKLIMADVIDEVSDDIDAEFDKIAELGL